MALPHLVPLDQRTAFALRAPLPLDDPQFLANRRAHFRLDGARQHLSAAFRQATGGAHPSPDRRPPRLVQPLSPAQRAARRAVLRSSP